MSIYEIKKKLSLHNLFFLFFSFTIFLIHQNGQLSRTAKNKEEVKRLLKELKKNNLNQKDKNEDYQEETDDLPWLLNWKGATISLVVCSLIAVPGRRIITKKIPDFNDSDKQKVACFILLTILFFSLPPFLLAIAKYKDKSYKERYCLLWRDYWKPFVCTITGFLFYIILLVPYSELFKERC